MSRQMRLYKRLLDISLFSSFGLLLLFVLGLIYGMLINAYQFTDPNLSFVKHGYEYLRAILIFLAISTFLFVVLARIFLGFIQNAERLQSAEEYKKKVVKREAKKSAVAFSETSTYKKITSEKESAQSEEVSIDDIKDSLDDEIIEDELDIKEEIEEVKEDKKIDEIEEVFVQDKEPIDEVIPVPKKRQFYTRMNKGELIKIVASATNLSEYKAKIVVNAMLDTIKDELVAGNDVKIEEFGKFDTKKLQERQGVNPQTGEEITIEAQDSVRFTPYQAFKDKITLEVKSTSKKYLRTRETEKVLTEDEMSDSVQTEVVAQEHVKVKAKQVVKPKKKAPKVPKKTKVDIINYIDETTELSKNKANTFLKYFAEVVKEELAQKKSVSIDDFGHFTTIDIPEKEAVNPSTQEKMIVEAHTQVRLRFDKNFKGKIK